MCIHVVSLFDVLEYTLTWNGHCSINLIDSHCKIHTPHSAFRKNSLQTKKTRRYFLIPLQDYDLDVYKSSCSTLKPLLLFHSKTHTWISYLDLILGSYTRILYLDLILGSYTWILYLDLTYTRIQGLNTSVQNRQPSQPWPKTPSSWRQGSTTRPTSYHSQSV
jgi:hypothetical protein